ncbi:hypothetical protein CSA37_00345 [Candidatus Fermentibacteria bacterium]|nr:MAG: hypothetical protein CSA37_00345 [Candidatus Fermentibacteria bacterium]
MFSALSVLSLIAALQLFNVETPDPVLTPAGEGMEITVSGFYSSARPGFCSIPETARFIPVPPECEPQLSWNVVSVSGTGWNSPMEFSSAPVMSGEGFDVQISWETAPFPPAHDPVSLEVVHMLGSTVAVVSVSPFCLGSAEQYISQLEVEVSFPDVPGARTVEGTLFETLSPGSERWWRYSHDSSESFFQGKPWARICIEETGFHSVTCSELAAEGCEVQGVPTASLAMYSGPGEMFTHDDPAAAHELLPVAIEVFDGGDGSFDGSDSLVFYGRSLWHWNVEPDSIWRSIHRYDDVNTFWLTWGGSGGTRISNRSVAPSGGIPVQQGTVLLGFEPEILWENQNNRTGWVWDFLFENVPGYFYLSSPVASDNATLRLGMTNSGRVGAWSHNVVAELEGETVIDTIFTVLRNEVLSVSGITLGKGGNLLKVWNDHSGGQSYMDFVEFMIPVPLSSSSSYPIYLTDPPEGTVYFEYGPVTDQYRIFDVTDPFQPTKLTGWTLEGAAAHISTEFTEGTAKLVSVSPGSFIKPVLIQYAEPGIIVGGYQEADVLVTVPDEFSQYIPEIEAMYAEWGLSVYSATYRNIYDEFGQGVSDPGAVRSFVRWAVDTWEAPPVMLQLIGDGSTDPLGYVTGYRTNSPVYIEAGTGNCFESFFTTFHSGSVFPELPYSRIPASTSTDLLTALEKSLALSSNENSGPWGNRVLLAADDEWSDNNTSDSNHTFTCEYMADTILDSSLDVVKLYLIDYPWPPGTTGEGAHPEKPEASSDFIEQLNNGVSSASFFGHGSYDQITREKLFASNMVSQLDNGPKYFLFNSFSCHTGDFVLPSGDCLSEILLNHSGGGAAYCLASTDVTYSTQNKQLATNLLTFLYDDQKLSIAESFWLALIETGNPQNRKFSVLGDGAIVLPRSNTQQSIMLAPDSLFRGQVNVVEVDFPGESFFTFTARASADTVHYVSPLTAGVEIDWLRYGSTIYTGIQSTDSEGRAEVSFFVPLQADTGSMGRTTGTGVFSQDLHTAYTWPVPVADNGEYSDDTEGPEIQLFFEDPIEGEIPSVWQNSVLNAELSDQSGICILGEDAGSIIICSIDGSYEDVTDLFSYDTGSSTTGSFSYTLPELLPGPHQISVVARDGMKNTGEGTIEFNVLEGERPLLEETGVFPNPGRGTRVFFFTAGAAGDVSVEIFTVTGRPVWHGSASAVTGAGQLVWDGFDADCDRMAAGSYIYKLTLDTGSGSTSVTGILVVAP